VLVNNAEIGGTKVAIDEISDSDWEQTIQVNLNGAFYCIKRAAKYMKQQNNGCIINISSASTRTRIHPSEIGNTAVFLANSGRHISGQEIGVCGNSEWEE